MGSSRKGPGHGRPKPKTSRPPHAKSERPKPARPAQAPQPEPFRVLLAVHRPRYRTRAERAVAVPGWEVRSLLNREDPIGLLNQKAPDVLVLSVDYAKNLHSGYLRAAQRFREAGLRIVVLAEAEEDAREAAQLGDAVLAPPWRTRELHQAIARIYLEKRGEVPKEPEEPRRHGGTGQDWRAGEQANREAGEQE